jgi:hypothetical protein
MKRLASLLVFLMIILSSCEKGVLNEDKGFNGMTAINHNSYVLLNSKLDPAGMPDLTIAKNGVVQEELVSRMFCKEISFELVAGQTIPAGNVIVSNDLENLYVTFKSANGWRIKEIHLFAGSFENIPLNNADVPVPGQFPINESFNTAIEIVTYEIPLAELPECPYILAHAVVVKDNQEETAWGKGETSFEEEFGIKRWGWVINFCAEECEGKDIVIGLKSYVVDPKTYNPQDGSHLWWVVTKGPGSLDNCLALGFNTFNTSQTGSTVFDLIKWGDLNAKSGTMTVFTTMENNIKYLNVVIDLDDDNLSFSKSYLYVGSKNGLETYHYTYLEKDCYKFYEWFYQNDEINNPKQFKIALTDIKNK